MKSIYSSLIAQILLIIVQRCVVICAEQEITHSTPLGGLIGLRKQVSGKDVYQFKQIPYAKPPIGLLRFAKPQPYGSWVGTFDARYFGPSCYQQMNEAVKQTLQNQAISEDCLHLNIYVPNNLSPTSNKSVMVWIHGGGYTNGQSQSFDGSHLAVTGDVIVVTINYRLNIFGFLSHGDIKGNFGLWDQKLAIEWLNDNIESFGGNSKSITMFGQSAGGFSVAMLSVVGSNEGLFQRAILQSASPLNPSLIASKSSAEEMSMHVAEYLNCSSDFSNDFTACVQNANTSDIFNAYTSKRSEVGFFKGATIGPVIDQDLILDDPRKMLMDPTSPSSKFFLSLDLMSGTVSGESSLIIDIFQFGLQNILQFNVSDSIPERILCNHFATDAAKYKYNGNVKVSDAICNKYWQGSNQDELSNSVVDMFSDVIFHVPEAESLRLHQTRSKQKYQYMYTFSRKFPFSFGLRRPSWFARVPHGGELMYLFSQVPMIRDDLNLSNQMMKYWTNFAKTGNVNGPGLPKWPEYDATEEMYLNFDVNITTGSKLYQDQIDFWLNDIQEIVNPRTTQAPSTYSPSSCGFKFQLSQTLQCFVILLLSFLLLVK